MWPMTFNVIIHIEVCPTTLSPKMARAVPRPPAGNAGARLPVRSGSHHRRSAECQSPVATLERTALEAHEKLRRPAGHFSGK